ncbi:putative receptor-like protein kinase [Iris pallida]|uniref:Glycosyltransferases n=1 Tax=Iris pallida TaxID=29817 RepID=A0AAX6FSH9_IRIPA|nr:putative receptor-like protein kinase [Iris pallida]
MASIRRTLSPSHRPSPPRPTTSHSSPSPLSHSPPSSSYFRRILMSALSFHSRTSTSKPTAPPFPRKWAPHHHHHHHRRSLLLRLFIFFLVGFIVGLSPFADHHHDHHDHHDFSFATATKPPTPPSSNLLGGTVVVSPEDLVSSVELKTEGRGDRDDDPGPDKLLIVVTPTYNRALQAYYLLRLAHTLRLVPQPLLWIVVETGRSASSETAGLLRGTGVMYRHLLCHNNSTDVKDRGVHQRNAALQHIERHRLDGIVYFADDDNVYSFQLFQHLREISPVSDQSRMGSYQLVSEPLDPMIDSSLKRGSSNRGSGHESPEEPRRRTVEESFRSLEGTILDLDHKLDLLEEWMKESRKEVLIQPYSPAMEPPQQPPPDPYSHHLPQMLASTYPASYSQLYANSSSSTWNPQPSPYFPPPQQDPSQQHPSDPYNYFPPQQQYMPPPPLQQQSFTPYDMLSASTSPYYVPPLMDPHQQQQQGSMMLQQCQNQWLMMPPQYQQECVAQPSLPMWNYPQYVTQSTSQIPPSSQSSPTASLQQPQWQYQPGLPRPYSEREVFDGMPMRGIKRAEEVESVETTAEELHIAEESLISGSITNMALRKMEML